MVRTLLASLTLTAAMAAPAAAQYSFPTPGNWTVDEHFDYTDGGSMKIAKRGTAIKKLRLKLDPETAENCGGARTVTLRGKARIRRTGASRRPAVGRLDRKTSLIEPRGGLRFKVNGGTVRGKLLVLFEENGKLAASAKVELRACTIPFVARV